MKTGTCFKCGSNNIVVMHHNKGYEGENKDFVLPYCYSCHRKAHIKARNDGKCILEPNEIDVLSTRSSRRRKNKEERRYIEFSETLIKNVRLCDVLEVFPNRIQFTSFFRSNHGKKLIEVRLP